jgi:hypothetical protein
MTTGPFLTAFMYLPPPASANAVSLVQPITVSQHPRHVRVTGAVTYTSYATNVVGDDGILLGVVATFPSVAPAVPSLVNAGQWMGGFWGRPPTTATEQLIYLTGTIVGPRRTYFDVEFDYEPENGGNAGALYVGHQALYVDPNHALPTVAATVTMWGYGA